VLFLHGRKPLAAGCIALVALMVVAPGSSVPTVNHELGINDFIGGPSRSAARAADPDIVLKTRTFVLGVDLLSEHSTYPDTTETVRMTLPAGLSWGERPAWPRTLFPEGKPGPWTFEPTSESCEASGQVVTCQASGVPSGTTLFGWIFDVVAAKDGLYKVVAEVVPPTDGQNRPPRGASTPTRAVLTVVIGERTGAVKTGGIVLSRPRPSFVRATVNVTQGGEPVIPTRGRCTGSFVSERSYQRRVLPASYRLGQGVVCHYVFNNRVFEGKTLAGELAFTVGRTNVKRTFSVRVGPGKTLSAPKGATIRGSKR
jgi:hypothetical protein